MNNMLLNLYVKFQSMVTREEGQDLIEYALIAALIALAAVAGVSKVTTALNTVFTSVSSTLVA